MLRMRFDLPYRHILAVILILGASSGIGEAEAAKRRKPAWDPGKYAAIVIDANTDKVLFSANSDKPRYPASLTKMMTLYVLFDDLAAGKLKKSTKMSVSAHAAGQAPSKLGLKPGQTITVDHAIRALVTKSANDVAATVAEHLAGSESAFAERMTKTARGLGMANTTFRNASGLPDSGQRTTAKDLSILARALIRNHPDYYSYFATRTFTYNGRGYRNHNRLLGRVQGVDGIKTGYINASGFNLTTSARRGKRHLVAVVMGGPTGSIRDAKMRSLLDSYFAKASTTKAIKGPVPQPDLIARVPVPDLRPREFAQADEATDEPTIDGIVAGLEKPQPKPAVLAPAGGEPTTRPMLAAVALPQKIPGRMPMAPNLEPTTLDAQHATRTGEANGATSAPKGLTILMRTSDKRRPIMAALTSSETSSPQTTAASVSRLAESSARQEETPAAGNKMNDTVASLIAEKLQDLWLIQIGAFDEEAAARRKLDEAQAESQTLKSRLAYTEPVTKNDLTLYRARFMGFDRGSAEAACAQLKKANFKCLAMKQ